jgi:hypothetical protein
MKPRSELYYFVPGQVILHLECAIAKDINTLEAVVEELLTLEPWNLFTRTKDPIVTIPITSPIGEGYIYLVPLNLIKFPLEMDTDGVYGKQDYLMSLLGKMYDQMDPAHPIIRADDITLYTVSPNWLTSGSPHQPGTGGPGAWPVPADPPEDNQSVFNFPKNVKAMLTQSASPTQAVEVAVLDTAPTENDIENAPITLRNNSLFKTLFGINGRLEIKRYGFSFWEDINHFSPMGHRYEMPDHGLFVAGIIHTIAPQVPIKLYEVLNRYGMGSYKSIYSGLARVLEDYKNELFKNTGKKLIINMSLVLNMPLMDPFGTYLHDDPGFTDRYITLQGKIYVQRTGDSIRKVIAQLVGLKNVLVIAAAGNDAHGSEDRPSARYPAACQGVIGVGGLVKVDALKVRGNQSAASYSNLCDNPLSQGCMTLGGEPGSGNGVRGVYLYKFPVDRGSQNQLLPGQHPIPGYLRGSNDFSPGLSDIDYIDNDTGWAWWAGTSFATPIISGLLAAGWSKNWGGISLPPSRGGTGATLFTNPAQNYLNNASGSNQTSDGERVIVVTQP